MGDAMMMKTMLRLLHASSEKLVSVLTALLLEKPSITNLAPYTFLLQFQSFDILPQSNLWALEDDRHQVSSHQCTAVAFFFCRVIQSHSGNAAF
jgi:hypothetical protein